jgi:hypothetical protein
VAGVVTDVDPADPAARALADAGVPLVAAG